jgi:hypothetical protein
MVASEQLAILTRSSLLLVKDIRRRYVLTLREHLIYLIHIHTKALDACLREYEALDVWLIDESNSVTFVE